MAASGRSVSLRLYGTSVWPAVWGRLRCGRFFTLDHPGSGKTPLFYFPGPRAFYFFMRSAPSSEREGKTHARGARVDPQDGFLVSLPTVCKIMRRRFPDCPGGFFDLPRQRPLVNPDRNLFYSDFDLEKIGDEAVRLLLSEKNTDEEIDFFANIYSSSPEIEP